MKVEALLNILSELSYECECIRAGEFELLGEPLDGNNQRYIRFLNEMKYFNKEIAGASTLLVKKGMDLTKILAETTAGIVVVENPKEVFYALHLYLSERTDYFKTYQEEFIQGFENNEASELGNYSTLSPKAYLGKNVKIGNNVTVLDHVIIQDNVTIKNNVVLGADGLMLAKVKGVNQLIPHEGFLVIESGSLIMDGCILQKGLYPWSNTIVGENCAIGGGTILAHGATVGENTVIVDGSIILGHTEISSDAWVGSGSVLKNRIKIGKKANVVFGSIVAESVPEQGAVAGFFAIDKMKSLIQYKKLKK